MVMTNMFYCNSVFLANSQSAVTISIIQFFLFYKYFFLFLPKELAGTTTVLSQLACPDS